MKRKSVVVSLILALSLVIGAFQITFAAAPANQKTIDAIANAKIKSQPTITNEVAAETFAMNLYREAKEGGYDLIDTAGVANVIGKDVLIIDTMPAGWWTGRHIPGAINCQAGGPDGTKGPEFLMDGNEKKALLAAVKKASGTKKVKMYYNKKTKKWQEKKIKGAKTKTVKQDKMDKKIIVYCGFVKCKRSHQAAMLLAKKGYTNVYRYPGGISAWVDAGLSIDGADLQ